MSKMKKLLSAILLSAITLVVNAQVVYNNLGNLTIGNPYHGCISTLCRTDSIYKYTILGNGNHGLWGFDLAESPSLSIHILQGIIDAYEGADTIWIQGNMIMSEKDKGFYVAELAPGFTVPEGSEFWFSIANMRKDIKYLRRIESGKVSARDRRLMRKMNREAKGALKKQLE